VLVTGIDRGLGKTLHAVFGGTGLNRGNAEEILASRDSYDAILHAAFNPRRDSDSESLYGAVTDNLLLTERLARLPHKQFVYISSIDVYPKNGGRHAEDELIRPETANDLYVLFKLMAESIVTGTAAGALILRCSAMLGASARRSSLIKILEDEKPKVELSPDSVFNYVLHSDIAAFIRYALENEMTGTFNAAARETMTLGEAAEEAGKKVIFGSYRYDSGQISNQKIAAVCEGFRKTSLETVRAYALEQYKMRLPAHA